MTEIKFIADQLHKAFEGDAWHGPSLREVLHGVSAQQAAVTPLGGAHSIWELLLHIRNWTLAPLATVKDGVPMPKVDPADPAFDWPAAPSPSEDAWQNAKDATFKAARELCAALKATPDGRLQQLVPGRDHTFQFMLHGVVQHTLYHAGQIALLKKMK